MSDDEADPELLELLRQSLGISRKPPDEIPRETGALKDAEYIYSNAIDVSIDMYGTKAAASSIYKTLQQRRYSTQTWSQHEFHPTAAEGFSDVDIVNFVFTMDLLNYSFWSDLNEQDRFQVEYQGKRWTGYKSLLACIRRALDEGLPITTPRFWNHDSCSQEVLRRVFRSATSEEMPLLNERVAMLKEAGAILHESFGDTGDDSKDSPTEDSVKISIDVENPTVIAQNTIGRAAESDFSDGMKAREPTSTATTSDGNVDIGEEFPKAEASGPEQERHDKVDAPLPDGTASQDKVASPNVLKQPKPDLSVVRLIEKAENSAGRLVNLLVKHFPSFRDETRFDGKRVRLLKRAQIFVADLWAAFNGTGYGAFDDIGELTIFADYRVPQMLRTLGVLVYSPPLRYAIEQSKEIHSGHSWEVQIRGCTIWAVELIRREILRQHPEAEATGVNAVLIDFLLYDLAKEREAAGPTAAGTPAFHRTRSIWY